MGVGSSKKEQKKESSKVSSTDLVALLNKSQEKCKSNIEKSQKIILDIKNETVSFINHNDIESAKGKIEDILKEEDNITMYELLSNIIGILKENCSKIESNNTCPPEIKSYLHSIIYASARLKIQELKDFREKINQKYGVEFISSAVDNKENLVNEVLIEKLVKNLANNYYSESLINIKLKQLCKEKKISASFLGNESEIKEEEESKISKSSSIYESVRSKNSETNIGKSILHFSVISQNDQESKEIKKKTDFDHIKTIEEVTNEDKFIIQKGEELFSPYDENIDKKCFSVNNIENWAESFYNLKSGNILEKFKEMVSKSEFKTFFEGLNYEYGINNCPLDTRKALEIYKKAANTTTDTLSMYRMYHIYKKDFKKFEIKERSHVLELFYLLKCFAYLTPKEKEDGLFQRFNIKIEAKYSLMNDKNIFYPWYPKVFGYAYKNFDIYDINKDDIILIEAVTYFWFEQKKEKLTELMTTSLLVLSNKENPEAMFNLINIYDEIDIFKKKYYEKLYKMKYYRCFSDYANELPCRRETLDILKESISNGYYSHIKNYNFIFMKMNEIESIFKSSSLKEELIYILKGFLDSAIFDDIETLMEFVETRRLAIKHFNFGKEFKTNLDPLLKEIINYLNQFMQGTPEENKKKIQSYFINKDFFGLFYTTYGRIYFCGVNGIIEKNYNEVLNLYNYLLKNDEHIFIDNFYLYFIYKIKIKERKLNNNKNNDKELIELEKKLINLYYEELSPEKIKKYPPSQFYQLSKLFSKDSLANQDMILEYVFLNRAANAKIVKIKNSEYEMFPQKYFLEKAKKKLKEKNKDENFKKMQNSKGAINVEGYGEDGTICPICITNKKSIIALPCKHFFCEFCMNKLLDKANCPICRTDIKITFDFNLKKENLIKTVLKNSYISDY